MSAANRYIPLFAVLCLLLRPAEDCIAQSSITAGSRLVLTEAVHTFDVERITDSAEQTDSARHEAESGMHQPLRILPRSSAEPTAQPREADASAMPAFVGFTGAIVGGFAAYRLAPRHRVCTNGSDWFNCRDEMRGDAGLIMSGGALSGFLVGFLIGKVLTDAGAPTEPGIPDFRLNVRPGESYSASVSVRF